MDARLEGQIRELERRIEELRASRPAHDFTGAHQMQLFELEEELDEKKKARRRAAGGSDPQPPTRQAEASDAACPGTAPTADRTRKG